MMYLADNLPSGLKIVLSIAFCEMSQNNGERASLAKKYGKLCSQHG